MSLGDLTPRSVATSFGQLVFWSRPDIYRGAKPVVLVIGGMFSPVDNLANLPDVLGFLGDACIMRLLRDDPTLSPPSDVASIAGAVGEAVASLFAGRPVVLLGISIGAVVALSVRAPNVARVLAIEPTLVTGQLWPIIEPLRKELAKGPNAAWGRAIYNLFGLTEEVHEDRNYLGVLQGLPWPADVILGDAPLQPERPVQRFPSLVGAAERLVLAGAPNVRLHLAAGGGHNVVGQVPKLVHNVLMEVCRRASAWETFDARRLDEPLLDATPLTARRLLYWGPHGELFRDALLRANPKASVVIWSPDHAVDEAGERAFDTVVAAGPPGAGRLAQLAGRLEVGGHLIARWSEPAETLTHEFAPLGLRPRAPVDLSGTGIVRAQLCAPGECPNPPLHIHTMALATLMMDIRTRLPTRALASDPELDIVYEAIPGPMASLTRETPKFIIVQRSAEIRRETWLPTLANAIRKGRIVIHEFDDHPLLVDEVMGKPVVESHMLRFGYGHAVQTSTPPLIEVFRPYNPEVAVFPNAAFDLAPFPEGERARRVIYGAVLRGDYGVAVARSLAGAIAQFPDAEFVVIGDRAVFDALPTRAKTYHPYMPFEAYLRMMSECAISLAPIAPLPKRETKSDAKFIDASRSGALTIASPTVYDRVIQPGVNGLIAREIADWSPLLAQALGDPTLTRTLARRAWEYVREERMFADQIAVRRAWYRDLWARREALNDALMDRVPGLRDLVHAS